MNEENMKEMISLAMECLGVAVTIIDTKGTLLYYNKKAAKILDRRPEYIGKDKKITPSIISIS